MSKIVKFDISDIKLVDSNIYPTDEFAIAKVGFLGSNPNSHKLVISDEVLQNCASTVLGKFLVADVNPLTGDATTHTPKESIVGYFPPEQTVTFEKYDGFIRAYADAVVSKIYAFEFCQIFENDNQRHVSVEMMIETENGDSLDDVVTEFNIVGVTALGKTVQPSSPGCEMEFTRFSEEKASVYFEKIKENTFTIKNFAEERRIAMAEEYVTHPIDTSKDSVYDGEWDGDKAKQDLVKEKNYATLAPKVCLRLEDGWKDREVTKLGYPVMCLHDGKWVYSRKGLASALGYAKQHNDDDIVKKVESIYKKLGLNSEGKEESAKMTEIEFTAVNIGDMWGKLQDALRDKYPYGEWGSIYWIDSVWEEGNKKYALIRKRDEEDLWRLDFSLTEDGLTLADEITKVEIDIVETDEIRRFADPENIAQYREEVCASCDESMKQSEDIDEQEEDDNDNVEMSAEQLLARISQLEKDIEDRDNIIMEKDNELEELRQFKQARLEQDKAAIVASVLGSMGEFMDSAELESCKNEGMACDFSEIDAWSNKVKASVVDKALNKSKKTADFTRIAGGYNNSEIKQTQNVWDRIK